MVHCAPKYTTKQKAVTEVKLKPGGEYLLLAKSINEGRLPTNTLKIELRNMSSEFAKEVELVSQKGTTQGIAINVRANGI